MPSLSYRLKYSSLCFRKIDSDSFWCRFHFSFFFIKLAVTCIDDRFYLFSFISYFFFIVIEIEVYVETNV